jgi:hypothetical protein
VPAGQRDPAVSRQLPASAHEAGPRFGDDSGWTGPLTAAQVAIIPQLWGLPTVRHGELSKARNHVALPASTICRRQVELFFKWINQHRRIKQFYGTSENAVKTDLDRRVDLRAGRHRPDAGRLPGISNRGKTPGGGDYAGCPRQRIRSAKLGTIG